MLADGELGAIFSATKPSTFDTSADIQYLFPNFKEVEADYYRCTRIFPIMHTVATKRDVYNANPWIAKVLSKAITKSMEIGYQSLEDCAALKYMLPWLENHLRETRHLMGEKVYWTDDFNENKHVIDNFLDYHYAQGLSKRRFQSEELVAPSFLEDFVIWKQVLSRVEVRLSNITQLVGTHTLAMASTAIYASLRPRSHTTRIHLLRPSPEHYFGPIHTPFDNWQTSIYI